MHKLFFITPLICNFIFPQISFALPKIEYEKDKNIEFFQSVQLFNVYTISNDSNIDNRNDLFIRRGRFGLQGKLEKDLSYKVCFAYDNVGKDSKTKLWGLSQNTENSNFSIFDAFFTYKLVNNLANITLGFFRPQIGRESITPAFEVTSFEKALTNFYIRPHLVGRGNGRDTGINLGGLYSLDKFSINYNIGFFDLNHEKITGGSSDSKNGSNKWSPLLASRFVFSFGDPEFENYKTSYNINYFGNRRGLSVGFNYTNQGQTDLFKQNNLIGSDILFNFDNFNFDAEFDLLSRNSKGNDYYQDNVFHIRASYNINVYNNYFLEPVVMYSQSNISSKSLLGLNSESQVDLGCNFYINKNNSKILAHIIQRKENNKNPNYLISLGTQFLY